MGSPNGGAVMRKEAILMAAFLLLVVPASTHAIQKTLVQVSIDGSILFFADGSKYRVESYDLTNTLKWRDRDQCDIQDSNRNEWLSVLIRNAEDGSTVQALRIQ